MRDIKENWAGSFGRLAKTMIMWFMLISGIILATRQVRAETRALPVFEVTS